MPNSRWMVDKEITFVIHQRTQTVHHEGLSLRDCWAGKWKRKNICWELLMPPPEINRHFLHVSTGARTRFGWEGELDKCHETFFGRVYASLCVYRCPWRPRDILGVLSHVPFTLIFETRSRSYWPESQPFRQQTADICLSLSPQGWGYNYMPSHLPLLFFSFENQNSGL